MSDCIFNDRDNRPTNELLSKKIGENFKYWTEIHKLVESNYENTSEEWKFYGKNYGWQLKTFLKKRNLFFLIPSELSFKIVFIFSDKAVEEIKISNIYTDLKNIVIAAKKYAEGRGLPITITNNKYISDIKTLIEIKVNN